MTEGSDDDHRAAGVADAVGDGRRKYVEVVTAAGERHEHGDVLLRESETAFFVSTETGFPAEETTVYPKEELSRVSVEQHHSACFITTAVAGEAETLASLRAFRDDALRPSPVGRPLVRLYELISPPIADTLAAAPEGYTARAVRRIVRGCAVLARRRRDGGPLATAALSVVLTLLYVVGVTVAAAGHAVAVARRRPSERAAPE
ncbi:CFI-box-CTERM domain-containing protein [Halobaculum marinum]|uniref:CFI-box-CTERM domain-containing protein n=1 Tax=Halobaculum marinum TaxID=3031996 RepID=A0ABD5X6T3_9EURY|nr:CFI-box-CTERM domain-containing protein [Halobaculum sp. DT55]